MTGQNNKRRTLSRMAVINAWFDPTEVPSGNRERRPRYAFRMDVAFRDERLGGGPGDPVRFRVRLKQCEVAVVLPRGEGDLRIDPRTIVAGASPASVTVSQETTAKARAHGTADLGISASGVLAKMGMGAHVERAHVVTTSRSQILPLLLGERSETHDGHLCWTVRRTDGGAGLEGLLWDARQGEPRFQLVDRRPTEARTRSERTGLHPTITVEVRAKREDLEIDGIELTDPEQRRFSAGLFKRPLAVKTAEAFIARELKREGLRVGDIHEPFSDLVVGDMLVSLVDDGNSDDDDALS